MKLTGKCEEEFEKWVSTQQYAIYHDVGERQMNIVPLADMIEQLHPSMQYGVYVDYFDWAGIIINIEYNHRYKNYWFNLSNGIFSHNELNRWNHRETARTAAIKKANEIYNQ